MVDWDQATVSATARRLRLGVDPRRRHGAGNRLGAGPGASLEFHDHRAYQPGDDLRHLDWNVLARSDHLVLRRYRQEICPRVEIVLDLSASMGRAPAKAALAAGLAALLAEVAERGGARPRLYGAGDAMHELRGDDRGGWRQALAAAQWHGRAGLAARPLPRLAPGAERLLVSDGLCPEGGSAICARLGRNAGRCSLVQVLARDEVDPDLHGALRLEDVEGGSADRLVDVAVLDAYRQRLARHQAGWAAALRGRGAGLLTCFDDEGLGPAVRVLLRSGLVQGEAAA